MHHAKEDVLGKNRGFFAVQKRQTHRRGLNTDWTDLTEKTDFRMAQCFCTNRPNDIGLLQRAMSSHRSVALVIT